MQRIFTVLLQIAMAGAVLIGLYGQAIVIPVTAADDVQQFHPYAPYQVPYTILGILGVLCAQAAFVAVFMLLGMVRRETIFTARAFRWLDVIIGAALAAAVLAFGVALHLFFGDVPSPGDGMGIIGAIGMGIVGAGAAVAFAMLMVVIRGVLRKAIELRPAATDTTA